MLFFTLIGFGLRVQKLSFQPLWGDEGWSFYFALLSLPQLLTLTALDIHPPLYYILLKGWLFIFGPGPEEARFLSVLFGTALIPVVGILGQRLFEGRVGAARDRDRFGNAPGDLLLPGDPHVRIGDSAGSDVGLFFYQGHRQPAKPGRGRRLATNQSQ